MSDSQTAFALAADPKTTRGVYGRTRAIIASDQATRMWYVSRSYGIRSPVATSNDYPMEVSRHGRLRKQWPQVRVIHDVGVRKNFDRIGGRNKAAPGSLTGLQSN